MSEVEPRIVTIDGDPGVGKTTLATLIAERDGRLMLTTGIFFCVTAYGVRKGLIGVGELSDPNFSLVHNLGLDLTTPGKPNASLYGKEIEGEIFSQENKIGATNISHIPHLSNQVGGIINDLTKAGNWVVDRGASRFKDNSHKIWLTANITTLAIRRCLQLETSGQYIPYQQVLFETLKRIIQDQHNPNITQRPANAIVINTDDRSPDEIYLAYRNSLREAAVEPQPASNLWLPGNNLG